MNWIARIVIAVGKMKKLKDEETQKGYNFKFVKSFENFTNAGVQSRFIATIVRKLDDTCVGSIFLSPENTLPD